MGDIKARIKGRVVFLFYQDRKLFYKCDADDFIFPVPIDDCGSARFEANEKAMLFMRWIRRHMQTIEDGNTYEEPPPSYL